MLWGCVCEGEGQKKQHSVQKHSTIQTQLHVMVLILMLTCVTSTVYKRTVLSGGVGLCACISYAVSVLAVDLILI